MKRLNSWMRNFPEAPKTIEIREEFDKIHFIFHFDDVVFSIHENESEKENMIILINTFILLHPSWDKVIF